MWILLFWVLLLNFKVPILAPIVHHCTNFEHIFAYLYFR